MVILIAGTPLYETIISQKIKEMIMHMHKKEGFF